MKIEYIDHMGSDLTVVNSARVSFDLEVKGEPTPSDAHLINYLARGISSKDWGPFVKLISEETDESEVEKRLYEFRNKATHFSPFTHPQITLRETIPIFIARQRFKSKVGFTENEISRRYVSNAPDFHYPEKWRAKAEDKKQGSSDDEVSIIFDPYLLNSAEMHITYPIKDAYDNHIRNSLDLYNSMISSGVCPEQARMVLPQSMMTSFYVTGSLFAFSRIYKLRSAPDAQFEIREFSKQWDQIIRPLFPLSWEALTK